MSQCSTLSFTPTAYLCTTEQARIEDTEAEIGTPLLGQLSAAEQAEVGQLQPQVTQLQARLAEGVGGSGVGMASAMRTGFGRMACNCSSCSSQHERCLAHRAATPVALPPVPFSRRSWKG